VKLREPLGRVRNENHYLENRYREKSPPLLVRRWGPFVVLDRFTPPDLTTPTTLNHKPPATAPGFPLEHRTMTHTPETLKAWQAGLGLSESGIAAYIGVPVHTWRKWCNGTRKPDAAPCALLDLLAVLPDAAPALHTERLESAHTTSKPAQATTQVSTKAKKRASAPSVQPDDAPVTPAPPPPWVQAAQALPDWMKTEA
jgi:hypothetical protein